jgi:carboxymethylenebutenolidase
MDEMAQLGPLSAYVHKPSTGGPWPAVVVIQEWWGLDGQTTSIADRVAGLGYLAVAPDLYHGELAKLGDSEKAAALAQKYGAGAPTELQGVYDALKREPNCSGKIGSMGFCFGGRMSLALGLSRPVAAVCMFYGGGMQQLFGQLNELKAPVLGLFGDRDQSIPVGTVEQFDKLLDQVGVEHEVVIYPDSGHAFFRDTDPSVYKESAAKDAWGRVTRFFAKNLH